MFDCQYFIPSMAKEKYEWKVRFFVVGKKIPDYDFFFNARTF